MNTAYAFLSLRTQDIATIAQMSECNNPQLAGEILILADDSSLWETNRHKVTGLPVYLFDGDDGFRLPVPLTCDEWNTVIEWVFPGCGFRMVEE